MNTIHHECNRKHPSVLPIEYLEQLIRQGAIPQEVVQYLFDHFKKAFYKTKEAPMDWPISSLAEFTAELTTSKNLLETVIASLIKKSTSLFKDVNGQQEFGVSRHVADQLYHIPQLLKDCTVKLLFGNTYTITAQTYNSLGDAIGLEYRFEASDMYQATQRLESFVETISGRQNKAFLACWQIANERQDKTYTCKLTELMERAYPNRSAYFSTKDKTIFYKDLLDLESTKFIVKKRSTPTFKSKKQSVTTYIIPLIQIHERKQDIHDNKLDAYPSHICLTVLQDPPKQDTNKLFFMATAIKHKTLDLHSDDTQLADIIQIRKSQRKDQEYLTFTREFFIALAQLEKTDQVNKTHANKLLLKKLQRFCEFNIIKECPKKIDDSITIKIR
jgi:hypothetical protein